MTVLLFIAAGCGDKDEPSYEGLTLKMWVERLDSPDPMVRLDALGVIKRVGIRALHAEEYIRNLARREKDAEVKMAAIETLEAMGAPVIEFSDFIDLYSAPIIPDEEEFNTDTDGMDSEMMEFMSHASVEEDIEYLQRLARGEDEDSLLKDTTMVPKDPDEFEVWAQKKQNSSISVVLNMLDNPAVLSEMIKIGDNVEREFALRKLGNISGSNEDVVKTLTQATQLPDSNLVRLAQRALKHWQIP